MLNVYNENVGVDKKNIDTSLFSESSLIYLSPLNVFRKNKNNISNK